MLFKKKKNKIKKVSTITLILVLCSMTVSAFAVPIKTIEYTVRNGDTYYLLARRFDTTIRDLSSRNPKVIPENISIGSKLKIAIGKDLQVHKVSKGDTLWKLSLKYRSSILSIAEKNYIPDPNLIYRGDILAIPSLTSTQTPSPTPSSTFSPTPTPTPAPSGGADITPPQIKSAETMPKVLNVGDTLTFRLNIVDDISGVMFAQVTFQNPSGSKNQMVPLEYDENLKLWTGSYIIKSTDEGGDYTKFFMNMSDNAGNQTYSWSLLDPFKDSLIFSIKR